MGTRGSFPWSKAADAWSWPLTSIYCAGQRMSGVISPLPHTPSWLGDQLKHKENFTTCNGYKAVNQYSGNGHQHFVHGRLGFPVLGNGLSFTSMQQRHGSINRASFKSWIIRSKVWHCGKRYFKKPNIGKLQRSHCLNFISSGLV